MNKQKYLYLRFNYILYTTYLKICNRAFLISLIVLIEKYNILKGIVKLNLIELISINRLLLK